ncbi:MAG: putative baseplate assembly protein [Oscillatoriophycideae cyanobacterium NC_groundwater_1537_Pr4_S-0.65um_50_18]|nr:putative baseplate assembly protein [Oscillatoriophycideae cyanobacterium NC_groundwater_1537_Pr4_S-0.65um_50_18]
MMNANRSQTDSASPGLDDCGCCQGITAQTPVEIANRPGLDAIAYRVGTQPQFKHSLLASLADSQLKTREDDDLAIALLDAWATVADVLTFYQERIANESYLRTATERLSLLYLARLIGYELRPGVAASTHLAFTLEDAIGATPQTTIVSGAKVQSVPQPGEQAQTFETVETIEARADWNALKPQQTLPQIVSKGMSSIRLVGNNTRLKPGGGLLLVTETEKAFRRIRQVGVDNATQQTIADLEVPPIPPLYFLLPSATAAFTLTAQPLTNTTIQSTIAHQTWKQSDLASYALFQGWNLTQLKGAIAALAQPATPTGVFAFRAIAAPFGYNAPPRLTYDEAGKPNRNDDGTLATSEWPLAGTEAKNKISLDSTYEEITVGSFIALHNSDFSEPKIRKVTQVNTRPRTDYGMSGKTTVLTLDSEWWNADNFPLLRKTTVYVQSEPLELAELPHPDPIRGSTLLLNGYYPELKVGQKAILTGERTDLKSVESEVMAIADLQIINGRTQIGLGKDLLHSYRRTTVTINANVALATHGETVREVLGSGDVSQSYAKFSLRQPPLTYISASTPSGSASTLQVRVNDLLWHEVPTLYGQGPDRVFVSRISPEGKTTIAFGDGQTGARPPSGQENITATYRKGIGLSGLVKAGQLSLLMTRPLGVKGVINPQDAEGAEDPEGLDQARRNAPLTVLTFDRIVSLQDYEDFARAFAGIAKALATWTWNGQQRGVWVTIAAANGTPLQPDSPLYKNLLEQMQKSGDPYVPLRVQPYRPAFFRLAAQVKIDADYRPDLVLENVRQQLRHQFSFEARSLGEGVALSQVIAVMQAVAGVVAVDVDQLYRFENSPSLQPLLAAAAPQPGAAMSIAAAELLTLDPASLAHILASP